MTHGHGQQGEDWLWDRAGLGGREQRGKIGTTVIEQPQNMYLKMFPGGKKKRRRRRREKRKA